VIEPPQEVVRFLERRAGVIGLAAIRDCEVAWATGAGGGDDAVFQAGSLSKTVTAATALELVERGELELDVNVDERLSAWHFPPETAETTLRQLLGHTAGVNVPFYPGYKQGSAVPTLAQSLGGIEPATTRAVEVDAAVVGRFRYSGGGFAVVQQLIEDVTATPFAEAAREMVLEPLGMERSSFQQPPPERLRDSAAWADWHLYPESSAAGLWTTPGDLARFVCAVQQASTGHAGPLAPRTGEAMTTPHASLPWRGQWRLLPVFGVEPPRSHGLGLFLRDNRFINLGGAARSFSALTGSTTDGSGAVVMTAGCRPPLVLRTLLALNDAEDWTGFRTSHRILRTLSR
jgi:CubicO group peptidase (beta-lactamase class C family)